VGRQQKAEFDSVEDTKAAKKGTGGGGLGLGWFDGPLSFGFDADKTNLRGFGGTSTDSSDDASSPVSAGTPRGADKGSGREKSKDKGYGWGGKSFWDPAGLDVDFREMEKGKELPHGLEVVDSKGVQVDSKDLAVTRPPFARVLSGSAHVPLTALLARTPPV